MHRWRHALPLLACGLFLPKCGVSLDLPRDSIVLCDSDDDCPGATICSTTLGRCVGEGQEAQPPEISNVVVSRVTPSGTEPADRFGVDSVVRISFDVNEELGQPPVITLGLVGREQVLTVLDFSAALRTFEAEYTVLATDSDGPVSVTIDATDPVGNPARAELPNRFLVDTVAPDLTSLSPIALTPDGTNLLGRDITEVTTGTTIRVELSFTEPLFGEPTVSGRHSGGSSIDFGSAVTSLSTFFAYEFQLTDTNGISDGTYDVTVDALDLALNDARLIAQSFVVDTTAPAEPTGLEYTRVPWGSESTGYVPSFSVQGTDVAPTGSQLVFFDGPELETSSEIGRSEVTASAFGPYELNRLDRPAVYAVALDAAGNPSDASASTGVQATVIGSSRWVATLEATNVTNPHVIRAHPNPWAARDPDPETFFALPDPSAAWQLDGDALPATGDDRWRELSRLNAPPVRSDHVAAYDSARGRVVVFGGGAQGSAEFFGDLWEWDGFRWFQRFPLGVKPSGRRDAAMAYDAARQRMVLFGGRDSQFGDALTDTWEWDGESWDLRCDGIPATDVCGTLPGKRFGHEMVYDSARGRIVMFGGHSGDRDGSNEVIFADGVWEFDGTTWFDMPQAGDRAEPGFGQGMAYHAGIGQVMVFGGVTDDCPIPVSFPNQLHGWDGTTWTDYTSAGPAGRAAGTLSYDPSGDRLVLIGGRSSDCNVTSTTFPELWQWGDFTSCGGGFCWELVEPTTPAGEREDATLTYLDSIGQALMFGGSEFSFLCDPILVTGYCSDTHRLVGNSWVTSRTSNQAPDDQQAAFAPDGLRGVGVLFGARTPMTCDYDETWDLGLSGWVQAAPATSPSNRWRPSMSRFDGGGGALLFGGLSYTGLPTCNTGSALSDTWVYDGIDWAQLCTGQPCPATPPARTRAMMAYDVDRDVVVMFGGQDSSFDPMQDTWEFGQWGAGTCGHSGYCWRSSVSGGPPPARYLGTLTYAGSSTLLLHGGRDNTLVCDGGTTGIFDDTWMFDGTTSTWSLVDSGSTPPLFGHVGVYDTQRGEVLLHGGCGAQLNSLGCYCSEVPSEDLEPWRWNGDSWEPLGAEVDNAIGSRQGHRAFYSEASGGMVVSLGGSTGVFQTIPEDIWSLDRAPTRRPGFIATFDWAAANVPLQNVTELSVSATASGSGSTTVLGSEGAAVVGSEVAVWQSQDSRWLALGSHSAAGLMEAAGSAANAQEAQSFVDASDNVTFVVRPRSTRGTATSGPTADLDYIEVEVAYTAQ